MPGVNYYDGSQWSEVAAVQQADGSTAPVHRWDGSQWVQIYPTESAPASGLARYNFEQDVLDSWNNNDGTDNSSAGYSTDSQVGTYSKDLDGGDDYVQTPININDSTRSEFSISAWVYLRTTDQFNMIVASRDSNSSEELSFRVDSNNKFEFFTVTDTGTSYGVEAAETTTTLLGSTWYHLAGTYDDANGYTTYIDGSEDASVADTGLGDDGLDNQIGRRNDGFYFEGLIDDVRIYTKELTATEVSNLYNNGSIN